MEGDTPTPLQSLLSNNSGAGVGMPASSNQLEDNEDFLVDKTSRILLNAMRLLGIPRSLRMARVKLSVTSIVIALINVVGVVTIFIQIGELAFVNSFKENQTSLKSLFMITHIALNLVFLLPFFFWLFAFSKPLPILHTFKELTRYGLGCRKRLKFRFKELQYLSFIRRLTIFFVITTLPLIAADTAVDVMTTSESIGKYPLVQSLILVSDILSEYVIVGVSMVTLYIWIAVARFCCLFVDEYEILINAESEYGISSADFPSIHHQVISKIEKFLSVFQYLIIPGLVLCVTYIVSLVVDVLLGDAPIVFFRRSLVIYVLYAVFYLGGYVWALFEVVRISNRTAGLATSASVLYAKVASQCGRERDRHPHTSSSEVVVTESELELKLKLKQKQEDYCTLITYLQSSPGCNGMTMFGATFNSATMLRMASVAFPAFVAFLQRVVL